MIHCYDANLKGSSPKIAKALSKGFPDAHYTTSIYLLEGDVAFFGSPKIWDSVIIEAQIEGRTWFYVDHCYFGKRFHHYRVTKNAYQHTGSGKTDCKRFDQLKIKIEPWKRNRRNIVICPPDKIHAGMMGIDADEWVKNTKKVLSENTDRPLIWRDRLNITKPLLEDLKDAHALVTYTSNASVDAVLFGVPVFCNGICGGSGVGLSDFSKIETPIYPDDRLRWAGVLADNQFNIDEIADGTCWRYLNKGK